MQYESECIEYKSQMVDDVYKEVIAFANTNGGVISQVMTIMVILLVQMMQMQLIRV